jgi:MscS family membrane protein
MKNSLRCCVVLVFLSIIAAAHGQSVAQEIDKAKTQNSPQTSATPTEESDPLGRSTPHGTVFGFLQATQSGKYNEATQYLQLSKNERATKGERVAHQLHDLMDSVFVGRVGAISDRREGSVQEGVPQDHERIGVFRINGRETSVDLVRVSDPAAGEIWLFSSHILAEVPELFSQIEGSDVEAKLPRFLATTQIFSTPLWRWVAFLLLVPVSIALAWVTVKLLRAGLRTWLRWRDHAVIEDVNKSLVAPATVMLTVVFHQIGIYFLGVPLLFRVYYQRIAGIILVAGLAWLVFRVINLWGERARVKALAGSGYSSDSIVLLGQRMLKALVVIVAGLVMLSIFGFDMTTAIAGLGIGSLAIAFAAQKTLENLIGGISILGDQVIRVGEVCRIGDKVGTVEDISLRSTRIRTLERTELSVPNGQLANMNLENLSRSDTSLFRTNIELRHETSPDQLRSLLREIPTLLRRHPKVNPEVARVRFIGFGESSLDIQIHCLILTGEIAEFLAIREELLLQIMDLVADAGVKFAVPARALNITQNQALDQQRTVVPKTASGFRHRS